MKEWAYNTGKTRSQLFVHGDFRFLLYIVFANSYYFDGILRLDRLQNELR